LIGYSFTNLIHYGLYYYIYQRVMRLAGASGHQLKSFGQGSTWNSLEALWDPFMLLGLICKENKMALGFGLFSAGIWNVHGWRSSAMELYYKATSMCFCFLKSEKSHQWNFTLIVLLSFPVSFENDLFPVTHFAYITATKRL
jgi:hypothetical protein